MGESKTTLICHLEIHRVLFLPLNQHSFNFSVFVELLSIWKGTTSRLPCRKQTFLAMGGKNNQQTEDQQSKTQHVFQVTEERKWWEKQAWKKKKNSVTWKIREQIYHENGTVFDYTSDNQVGLKIKIQCWLHTYKRQTLIKMTPTTQKENQQKTIYQE